jgi:hypothetical protein
VDPKIVEASNISAYSSKIDRLLRNMLLSISCKRPQSGKGKMLYFACIEKHSVIGLLETLQEEIGPFIEPPERIWKVMIAPFGESHVGHAQKASRAYAKLPREKNMEKRLFNLVRNPVNGRSPEFERQLSVEVICR